MKYYFIIPLLFFVIIQLLIALVQGNINVFEWSQKMRIVSAALGFIAIFYGAMAAYYINENDK